MPIRPQADVAPLARFATIQQWRPRVGDFLVMAGWFKTAYGIVSGIDGDQLTVVCEALPQLLVTLKPEELVAKTISIDLVTIRAAWSGSYSAQQLDPKANVNVWYV